MRDFENHIQWPAVKEVWAGLTGAGYQALLAGGCVRDAIMGRTPNDFDIATNATPEQVAEIFPQALLVGRAFGVTMIPFAGFQVEVATFRVDLEYKDGRRPEGVRFSTPEEDARRRDFTVNALFYDLKTQTVIDFVGGQKDIKDGLLRTVGEADRRFDEDKLRILRAVRFSAQLGFKIDSETWNAILQRAKDITVVSRERVRGELEKLFQARERVGLGLRLLFESKLLKALFPDLAREIEPSPHRWWERLERLQSQKPALGLNLSGFFLPLANDTGKLKSELHIGLKLDNQTVSHVLSILRDSDLFLDAEKTRTGLLAMALARASGPAARVLALDRVQETDSSRVHAVASILQKIENEILNESGALPEPWLSGEDLKTLGFKAGPTFGTALQEVFLLQIEGKLKTKTAALEWARSALKN